VYFSLGSRLTMVPILLGLSSFLAVTDRLAGTATTPGAAGRLAYHSNLNGDNYELYSVLANGFDVVRVDVSRVPRPEAGRAAPGPWRRPASERRNPWRKPLLAAHVFALPGQIH